MRLEKHKRQPFFTLENGCLLPDQNAFPLSSLSHNKEKAKWRVNFMTEAYKRFTVVSSAAVQ